MEMFSNTAMWIAGGVSIIVAIALAYFLPAPHDEEISEDSLPSEQPSADITPIMPSLSPLFHEDEDSPSLRRLFNEDEQFLKLHHEEEPPISLNSGYMEISSTESNIVDFEMPGDHFKCGSDD